MENLISRLNIENSRGEFLSQKIQDAFFREMKNKNKDKDAVDMIHEMRQLCQNASEDIFVCYMIGGIQARLVALTKSNDSQILILKSILNKLK